MVHTIVRFTRGINDYTSLGFLHTWAVCGAVPTTLCLLKIQQIKVQLSRVQYATVPVAGHYSLTTCGLHIVHILKLI